MRAPWLSLDHTGVHAWLSWTCASQDGVTDGLADGEGRLCNRRLPHKLHALPEPLEPHLHNHHPKRWQAACAFCWAVEWRAGYTAAILLINDDDDDDLLRSGTLVAAGALGRL